MDDRAKTLFRPRRLKLASGWVSDWVVGWVYGWVGGCAGNHPLTHSPTHPPSSVNRGRRDEDPGPDGFVDPTVDRAAFLGRRQGRLADRSGAPAGYPAAAP